MPHTHSHLRALTAARTGHWGSLTPALCRLTRARALTRARTLTHASTRPCCVHTHTPAHCTATHPRTHQAHMQMHMLVHSGCPHTCLCTHTHASTPSHTSTLTPTCAHACTLTHSAGISRFLWRAGSEGSRGPAQRGGRARGSSQAHAPGRAPWRGPARLPQRTWPFVRWHLGAAPRW